MRLCTGGLLLIMGASACQNKADDSGTTPPPLDTSLTDTGDCGGTPPVVELTACSYPGAQDHEEYDDPVPVIQFTIHVTDEDGDIHQLETDLYVDPVADGSVDPTNTDVEYVQGHPGTVSGADACQTFAVNITQNLFLPPGFVTYGEDVDWGAVVLDSAGISSDMAVITCAAPNEDGSEPAR